MKKPQIIYVIASSVPLDLDKDIQAQVRKAKATIHGKFVDTIEEALKLTAEWATTYRGYYIYTKY